MREERKLFFGLGNPTLKYHTTYHNVGSLFVSYFLKKNASAVTRINIQKNLRFEAWQYKQCVMARSLAYMNDSGTPVLRATSFFEIIPTNLIILHDDADIPLGTWKYEHKRGDAGHHGVQSIITSLGTKNFYRIRIGIRARGGKASEFVLQRITKKDLNALYSVFDEIIENVIVNASC